MSPLGIWVVIIYTEKLTKMDIKRDPKYELFDGLLKRHVGLIRTLCWRHSSYSDTTCRELVQDCYVAIWFHLSSLREDSNIWQQMTWVAWQCQSVFSHRLRHRFHDWLPIDDHLADTLADSDGLSQRELIEELATDLNPRERSLLTLFLEGYHQNEIAEKLETTPAAVKKMKQRIISKMANNTRTT